MWVIRGRVISKEIVTKCLIFSKKCVLFFLTSSPLIIEFVDCLCRWFFFALKITVNKKFSKYKHCIANPDFGKKTDFAMKKIPICCRYQFESINNF